MLWIRTTYDGLIGLDRETGRIAHYQHDPGDPNPFNPQTQFMLAVKRAQHVEVAVHDVLGRRVAVLFDGAIAAHQTQALIFRAAHLVGDLYLIRASGEHFTAQRTVMLLK